MFFCFCLPPADIHLHLSSPMFCHSSLLFNVSALTYLPPCLLLIISSPSSTSRSLGRDDSACPSRPHSLTQVGLHSSSAATGALWHQREGLHGMRVERGGGGTRFWLHGTANIMLTGEWVCGCPLAPRSRDMLQPTWQNTSVCVCVCSIWMTSHVA